MNYNQALDHIYSREKFGIKLGLDNISALLKSFNNPQDKVKTIHIAGTNGKGSTLAILAKILQDAGYKVGTYTSPHLIDFRERIKINNKLIPKQHLAKIITKIKENIKDQTFFEITTALAFQFFKEQKVDFAIIEVGLGGRLDATNTIKKPLCSIITNIALDHTEILGNSYEKIAYEKSGIIKKNTPVITGTKNKNALRVIKLISKKNNSKLYITKQATKNTNLNGEFQKNNLALALKAIKILKLKISEKQINQSIKKVFWPGRLQFIKENILIDCAHNPQGTLELAKFTNQIKKNFKNIHLITGIMNNKDISKMANNFEKITNNIILTKPKLKRSASLIKLKSNFTKKTISISSIPSAIKYAQKKQNKNDLLIISGSIFTISEAMEYFNYIPFKN